MHAQEQTERMLAWWHDAGIDHADLAVARAGGAMVWHRHVPLADLPLSWARAENVRRGEVYIRPARGCRWPLLFLDDVSLRMTHRVIRSYSALAVQTSQEGGCHVWVRSQQLLDEAQRAEAQRWLVARTGADPASVSGEHLGRLAGFKNWKRGGPWVNVIALSPPQLPAWDAAPALGALRPLPAPTLHQSPTHSTAAAAPAQGRDASPSGREWAWTCCMLESGIHPDQILVALVQHATPRRGSDASRYARLTLRRALAHCAPVTPRAQGAGNALTPMFLTPRRAAQLPPSTIPNNA